MAPDSPGMDDFTEGMEFTDTVFFGDALVQDFIRLTGDRAPAHLDATKARVMGFAGRIVHGLLIAAPFSTILGMHLPGPRTVIQSMQLDFRQPVLVGQHVFYRVKLRRLVPAARTAIVDLSAEVDDVVALTGNAKCIFREPQSESC